MSNIAAQRNSAKMAEQGTSPRGPRPMIGYIVRAALGFGLIGLLLWRYGGRGLFDALSRERPAYFVAASALYVAGQVLSSYRWMLLARLLELGGRFAEYLSFYFIGVFTNLFVPGLVGGDAARAAYLARRFENLGKAAASVIADRSLGLVMVTWFAAVCTLAWGRDLFPPALSTPIILFGAATMLGYLALPLGAAVAARMPARIARIAEVVAPYLASRLALMPALILSLILQFSLVVCQFLLARGLGIQAPFSVFILCVPAGNFFASIPVTINGLGLRESAYVYLFGLAGVAQLDAIAMGILWFGVTVVCGAVGALAFLFTRVGRRHATEMDSHHDHKAISHTGTAV